MTDPVDEGSGGSPSLVFLHTASVHVQTFDALLRCMRPEARARHVVREDLLELARSAGSKDSDVRRAVREAIASLDLDGLAVLLCTCSTIGGCAESAGADLDVAVLRVDRAMAERVVSTGSRIVVAAALASTFAPTQALILESAARAGVPVKVRPLMIEETWSLFRQGDFDGYMHRIADALVNAPACDVIVLAQASMAGAADLCDSLNLPVLSSPRLGLERALAAVDRTARPD